MGILSNQVSQISTRLVAEDRPAIILTLPSTEIEKQINRLCFPGMHRNDLFSALAKLTTSGITHDAILANAEFFDQYISPESVTMKNKTVVELIEEHRKDYGHQVGSRPYEKPPPPAKGPVKDVPATDETPPLSFEELEEFRITTEKYIPEQRVIMKISGEKAAVAGNIASLTAESKVGKTAFKNVVAAGAISETGLIEGFEGLEVTPNKQKQAVIDLDTEQSKSDQQHNLKIIQRRVGIDKTPDFYYGYNVRTLAQKDYKHVLGEICRLCSEKHNGIHIIFIDGAADFIKSVNNEEEAKEIIAFFTWLAEKYDCAVILIIHLNENAGKNGDTMPRGHLGRQAVRKGYIQLNMVKEGEVTTVQALKGRKAGADTPTLSFTYNKERGYHVSVDAGEVKLSKNVQKMIDNELLMWNRASEIFTPPRALLHKEAIPDTMKMIGQELSSAKKYLQKMVEAEMVLVGADKCYRLNMDWKTSFS